MIGGSSYRRNLAPEYKQGRAQSDPALRTQLDAAPGLLAEAGLAATTVPGWEADDILASVSRAATQRGWRCVVVTSDRDAYQLVDDRTLLIKPDGVVVDTDWLQEKLGVNGDGYRHLAALRGEQSDNLTGVPGIGDKTAAKLLHRFSDVDAALNDIDAMRALIGPAATSRIEQHLAVYRRNLDVATLRRDLPIDDALDVKPDPARVRAAFIAAGLPVAANKLASALGKLG
jgi:DNA polymerase-1